MNPSTIHAARARLLAARKDLARLKRETNRAFADAQRAIESALSAIPEVNVIDDPKDVPDGRVPDLWGEIGDELPTVGSVSIEGKAIPPDLYALVFNNVTYPLAWFGRPNTQFGGRRPIDLVGTEDESMIRDVMNCVKLGLF